MVKIVQKEDPVLRKKAQEIKVSEIESLKIKKIIDEMKEALDSQEDGVAIAAPQIGISLRIFIVSGKVPSIIKLQNKNAASNEEYKNIVKEQPDEIYINPRIIKTSKEKEEMEEGCLSVRWLYGKVKRAKRVTIEAYNEKGGAIKKGAGGLLAQIFQHETEHLDGVLFIDKATDVEEMRPDNKLSKLT